MSSAASNRAMAHTHAAPDIFILSPSPVRRQALQAIFPAAKSYDARHSDLGILLCEGNEDVPEVPLLTFVLAPARPPRLPHAAHWLATPLSPATLSQHITRAWKERPRTLAGHQFTQAPGVWHAPDTAPIALTDKEAQLLAELMDTPIGLPREALLEHLWGMDASRVDTHALETQLYRLRQKLQPAWQDAWFLGLKEGICLLQPPA